MCGDLLEDGVEVEIMWNTSHVELEGNEFVNKRARHASLNGAVLIDHTAASGFSGFGKICFAVRVAGEVRRCRHW
jgi:hypothetical protein